MRYSLEIFPSISETNRQQLASVGITDSDALLAAAATSALRKELANKTKMDASLLEDLAGIADLLRVKGIGPRLAEALVKSGTARNAQELRSKALDAETFRESLKSYLEGRSDGMRTLSLSEIADIAEEAGELRPRLILDKPDDGANFRAERFVKAKRNAARDLRMMGGLIAIVTLAAGLVLAAGIILINSTIERTTPPGALGSYYADILRITAMALYLSEALTGLIFILGFSALALALYFLHYLMDTRLVLWLFDNPSRRDFFSKVNSMPAAREAQIYRRAIVFMGILLFGLASYTAYTLWTDMTMKELSEAILPFGVGGGLLLVLYISLPVLRFYRKAFADIKRVEQSTLQRYFIHTLFKAMTLPLAVLLLLKFVIPSAVGLHEYIYRNAIAPSVQNKLLEQRRIVESLQFKDEIDQRAQRYVSQYFVEENLKKTETLGSLTNQQGIELLELGVRTGLHIVVWWTLAAYLLLFVLPYLLLGGWRRGLFYMAVLACSFYLEDRLSLYAPSWFRLPADSAGGVLLIGFLVFANALLFDWIFDNFSNKSKTCPSCETILEVDDLYCSECGCMQK
ncbi:MAG: DUF4332 domain-containing protein [Chloroflexi bacterium]|nr:DUF4332 domain-containing protein [Chloroflexota bacterium]